jgi:hypothetical protein
MITRAEPYSPCIAYWTWPHPLRIQLRTAKHRKTDYRSFIRSVIRAVESCSTVCMFSEILLQEYFMADLCSCLLGELSAHSCCEKLGSDYEMALWRSFWRKQNIWVFYFLSYLCSHFIRTWVPGRVNFRIAIWDIFFLPVIFPIRFLCLFFPLFKVFSPD